MTELLPYAYSLLVFAIVTFLFILLGRIFLNVETLYFYRTEKLVKKNDSTYGVDFTHMLIAMGKEGWQYVGVEETMTFGAGLTEIHVIFVKTKTKFRLFR